MPQMRMPMPMQISVASVVGVPVKLICLLGMALWLTACAGGQNGGQNAVGTGNQIGAPANFDTVAKPVVPVANVQDRQVPTVSISNNTPDDTGIPDDAREVPLESGPSGPRPLETRPPETRRAQPTPVVKRPGTLPEPPPNKVSPPAPDIRQLVGMDRRELGAMLGKPTLRRNEPPAEVWQYAAGQCVLHLFLYADAVNGPYRVSHIDAVPRRKGVLSVSTAGASAAAKTATMTSDTLFQQDCFGQLLNRATAQNTSSETGKTVF